MRPLNLSDFKGWSETLRAIVKETRQDARVVVTQRVRAALGYIMSFTPPKNRAQGRAAVVRDIRSTMRPVKASEINTPRLKKIVARGAISSFNAFAAKLRRGPFMGHQAVAFSPNVHERARDRRGRVLRNYKQVVLGNSDSSKLRRYVELVKARVGWARSGWLAALEAVGGKAPAWVTRHGTGQGAGSVIDSRSHPSNPEVTVINDTDWAAYSDEGVRVVRNALRIHSRIMERDVVRVVAENSKRRGVPFVRYV